MSFIQTIISESIQVKQQVLQDVALIADLEKAVLAVVQALKSDKKILFCGNGGSAADAQHLSAELSGRFYKDRDPFFAEALHVNTSYMTAVANDYSYEEVYARLIKAMGKTGDILIALSTSGNSANILKAIDQAQKQGMTIIGFTGETGGEMASKCHLVLKVPSRVTPRIQESHILLGHILCELVEIQMTTPHV